MAKFYCQTTCFHNGHLYKAGAVYQVPDDEAKDMPRHLQRIDPPKKPGPKPKSEKVKTDGEQQDRSGEYGPRKDRG